MTAPTWRGVVCRVLLDSRVLGGRLDDGPDVVPLAAMRGWLKGLVVPLAAMRGWLKWPRGAISGNEVGGSVHHHDWK